MATSSNSRILWTISLLITIFSLSLPAQAKYSGGTGEPNDPYQIATADDLMLLGETPNDYNKHFLLTADIDLDPNLPGRKVFDRAVIAPDMDLNEVTMEYQGTPFTGVFDGQGHTISHLTTQGGSYLGLFGQLGSGGSPAGGIRNLGLVDVNIIGTGRSVGGLVGLNFGVVGGNYSSGSIVECHSTGTVSGTDVVGSLVGNNGGDVSYCYSSGSVSGIDAVGGLAGNNYGTVTRCYSTSMVTGTTGVGGLVGHNNGSVTQCYGEGSVSGDRYVGGLVGSNTTNMGHRGMVAQCYSTGTVSGYGDVGGGLVGFNQATVTQCYSTGAVSGTGADQRVGGLVGLNVTFVHPLGTVIQCFWDVKASGQTVSDGGTGKTTAEMQSASTFLDAGWDFVGETVNGPNDIWTIVEGQTYPLLSWQKYSGGTGEPNDPYQIATAEDLMLLGETPEDYDKHFILTADIDLDPNLPGRKVFDRAVIAPDTNDEEGPFTGVFDGNGHTILHLTITGASYLGLFGQLDFEGEIRNLGAVDVNIVGFGWAIGGLVGHNVGNVTRCYIIGLVSSDTGPWPWGVGGLVGYNYGNVTQCYTGGTVRGGYYVGGLVGENNGDVTCCYSTCAVSGSEGVGGLIGWNYTSIAASYSTGTVSGNSVVGGLVGANTGIARPGRQVYPGTISNCYARGVVDGNEQVGGLVGYSWAADLISGFWDMETSGQTVSDGGTGKTTAEMQIASTFLDAGWDFVGETANGSEDIWKIAEGLGYPHLAWEKYSGGSGTAAAPYQIATAADLIALGEDPNDYDKHFILTADIDLDPNLPGRKVFDKAVIAPDTNDIEYGFQGTSFTGVFDGSGHVIRNVDVTGPGSDYVGLFGYLQNSQIMNLGVENISVIGKDFVGGLVGFASNDFFSNLPGKCTLISNSYSTGSVSGEDKVGGLVGISGRLTVPCKITNSYSNCSVSGNDHVGGLVGMIDGVITNCYSSGSVIGTGWSVGGLVGYRSPYSYWHVSNSFWDTQTTGQVKSSGGGTGKTTAEMQTASTFLEAGWDFVDETANGTEDIWWILEGQDYPRLWWEAE